MKKETGSRLKSTETKSKSIELKKTASVKSSKKRKTVVKEQKTKISITMDFDGIVRDTKGHTAHQMEASISSNKLLSIDELSMYLLFAATAHIRNSYIKEYGDKYLNMCSLNALETYFNFKVHTHTDTDIEPLSIDDIDTTIKLLKSLKSSIKGK